ncbi:MAG: hypothetical protein RL323_1413 [Pseudomonadota bacterium]
MNWQAVWRQRGPVAWALLPLSLLYGALLRLHRLLFQMGVKQPKSLPVPVLVVGNVVVGGAGKTPTTIALVQHLQSRGLKPGVVSRGYGRKTADCTEVAPTSLPNEVGDEPLLIQRATGAPVVVCANRHWAGKILLERHPHTDVVVCDDGMQHLALARDVTVVVFDERGCGNGWLLPAGLLREPWPAPNHTHSQMLVLQHGNQRPGMPAAKWPSYSATRRLNTTAVNALGQSQDLGNLGQTATHGLLAVAGIAQPNAFFDMLEAQGLALEHRQELPDHASAQALLQTIKMRPGTWLCTEKDAVKLFPLLLEQHPSECKRVWSVALVQTPEASFFDAVDRALEAARQRLSSPHGPQTS